MEKGNLITFLVILGILVLSGFVLKFRGGNVEKELAICIGENSKLYIQFGCSHCKVQEDMFGDSYQYLNVIDCWVEREKCEGVAATPTWIINGETYLGVQSIEKLQELTGC